MRCKRCGHSADAHRLTIGDCSQCDCKRLALFLFNRPRRLIPGDAFYTGLLDPWDAWHACHLHVAGQWGCISEEQRAANLDVIKEGTGTIVSCYPYRGTLCIWIITEAPSGDTTVLLAPLAEGTPQ